jgi:hypothetical protein
VTRAVLAFLFVIAIVVSATFTSQRIHDDPEHVRPPHAAPADARVAIGPSLDAEQASNTADVAAFLDGLARAEWIAEQERLERERQDAEEAQRLEAARRAADQPVARPGTSQPASCDGHVIPGYIVQRESGCNYGAVNPTGCSGYSCVGLYQFDLRHFTSGACRDLDWHDPAQQDECARRLSNNGTNLAPWGG